MKPRPHQLECLQHVIEANTIVNMPTGTGKTLVAVLAIDHFRKSGKVMLLVPTRPLVSQQAEYIRQHASETVAVAELQGAQTDHLTAAEWHAIVERNGVLVGTAEVFRRALVDTKFLRLASFSLLIFDECHNATGNSPMAALMRDAVHRAPGRGPRILGLTASFVHGSLKGIEKKRKDLEGLLQAKIFCPDVEERAMDFERVEYLPTVLPEMEQVIESKIQTLLHLAESCGVPIKETKAVVRRGLHVFSELGMSAFIYFLRECIVPQVQAHIETLTEYLPSGYRSGPQQAMACLPKLRQEMCDAAERLSRDGALTDLPFVSGKAKTLFELIDRLHRQGGKQTRVIVFCEQTVLAHPLAHLIQEHADCKAGTCTGVGSMTDSQRRDALKAFRDGSVPLLTCTAALEEGLDVSECEVVIRFSQFQTTKSHIQGSGRARAWNARVFYFDNDPGRELASAALMERTAKASSLSLSPDELRASRAHTDAKGVHPFHTGQGAEISIFNCVQLVYEYTARTMGASFRPEESMLQYESQVVCEFPLQHRKTLVAATLPSPDGFFKVQCDSVDAWWGGVDLDDVAEQARMKNWDASDRELRRFMFVVAIVLSRRGLLDEHNQPSTRALQENRRVCEAWQMSPGVRIGVRYDPKGLQSAGEKPQSAAPRPRPETTEAGGATNGSAEATENYKGKLNQITKDGSRFSTESTSGGFVGTVILPDGRSFCSTTSKSTKKAAEQSAAEVALRALGHLAGLSTSGSAPSIPSRPAIADAVPQASDLCSLVLATLLEREVIPLAELVKRCGAPKTDVNRHLYDLQRRGLADKIQDVPPVWTAITHLAW